MLSTHVFSTESGTVYALQDKRLASFHPRDLCRILDIQWQNKVTNTKVFERTNIPSLQNYVSSYAKEELLMGLIHRMQDGRPPKDIYMVS